MINYIFKKIRLFFEAIYYDVKYKSTSDKRQGIQILNCNDSIKYVKDNKCSVSRFGDGELSMIFNQYDSKDRKSGFQIFDRTLAKRLENILKEGGNPKINHIVGLPGCMLISPSYMTGGAHRFWKRYAVNNIDLLNKFINRNSKYIDSTFSRFYIEYKNKKNSENIYKCIKSIWTNRDIVIIEGEKTRMGVGNDLFSNAISVKRILGPSINAYEKYDEILNLIIEKVSPNSDKLILLALGMTATILARDLANFGYQAIDIGHVDIEYEWMLRKTKKKISIPGKYTNESKSQKYIEVNIDQIYLSQIIGQIKI